MKIGILGSGDVAKVLAGGFLKHGHTAMVGSRTPEKLAAWAGTAGAATGTFAQAAEYGELLVLAVKGHAAVDVLQLAESKNLAGKAVIDACNPIADAPPVKGVLQFYTTPTESLMETLQSHFPAVHFVKAFNSVGNARMVNPEFAAKKTVARICDQFGWETADMGAAEAARAIEPLCMLWCIPGFLHNQWTHAFKLLLK